MMTSSPGPIPARSADISSAAVQEWVSNARDAPVLCSSQSLHRRVKVPSPASLPRRCASAI